jgi:hypothetical protein
VSSTEEKRVFLTYAVGGQATSPDWKIQAVAAKPEVGPMMQCSAGAGQVVEQRRAEFSQAGDSVEVTVATQLAVYALGFVVVTEPPPAFVPQLLSGTGTHPLSSDKVTRG